jgi:hypothetical protein
MKIVDQSEDFFRRRLDGHCPLDAERVRLHRGQAENDDNREGKHSNDGDNDSLDHNPLP